LNERWIARLTNINDLWCVYKFDEKWTQLQTQKYNVIRFFHKLKSYQTERLTQDVERAILESARLMKDEDWDWLQPDQSLEELNLALAFTTMSYLKCNSSRFQQRQKDQPMDVEGELDDHNFEEENRDPVKQPRRNDLYSLCSRAGLDGLVRNYGLTPEQLFHRDEFSRTVQQWNHVRSQVIDCALNKYIYPALVKELKSQLINEAKETTLR
jgi:transcription elongation factor SPT6